MSVDNEGVIDKNYLYPPPHLDTKDITAVLWDKIKVLRG